MRESQKMHSTASRAEVPNLGYVRNQGGRQFKILIENVLECLITIHYGVREFSFFMPWGARSEKGWVPLN